MNKNFNTFLVLFCFLIFSFCSNNEWRVVNKKNDENNSRIISLAPALTEIIFRLGSGKNIVGNTKFCKYPREAIHISKIGGFLDINIEAILKLKPDIIICYPEHLDGLKMLKDKIKFLVVKHSTISDILNSILIIGEKIKRKETAIRLYNSIKRKIYFQYKKDKKKKILLIADRATDSLKSIYIIGNKGFLNELINIAGAKNAYNGNIPYPSINIESIITMNPDIIIEFSFFGKKKRRDDIMKLWRRYDMVNAVKNNKIYFVKEDFWQKPGPRIVKIAKKLREMIN